MKQGNNLPQDNVPYRPLRMHNVSSYLYFTGTQRVPDSVPVPVRSRPTDTLRTTFRIVEYETVLTAIVLTARTSVRVFSA